MLFICTANQCRSPMAAALARLAFSERGCAATVASAGLLSGGAPISDGALEVMAECRLDLRYHRSRQVTPGQISAADLVLTMTRQHLLDVVLLSPDRWSRCFTLVDAVRRGDAVGARPSGMEVGSWVQRLGQGRSRSGLLSLQLADDIVDPFGQRRPAYVATRNQLQGLVSELAGLLCPA